MIDIRYGKIDPYDVPLQRYQEPKPRVVNPLTESVRQKGFVNPVIVWATKGELRPIYGTSRVWVGAALNMLVPAVVVDYDKRYPDWERLNNLDEIAAKWANPAIIRPHLLLSDTKLWMNYHPRVPINENGDCF